MKIYRTASTLKQKIDAKISKQRGQFSKRTPHEAKEIFGLKFDKPASIKNLELGDSNINKLSPESQTFLSGALSKYTLTFPEPERLTKSFDSFQGNDSNMSSQIEFYLRSVIMVGYEKGVSISLDEAFFNTEGKYKGNHDLTISKQDRAVIVCRFAKKIEDKKFHPIDSALSSIVFELYEEYWKNPQREVFGCVSDLNNWIFLKYNGIEFFRTHRVYKLALHNTAIVSLAIKILNILEEKPYLY